MKVLSTAPTSKYSQRTDESIINAVNKNSVFSIDPRVDHKNCLASSYSYTRPENFSCLATTGQGHVCVGSEKGEIRLFSGIGLRAKTCFPGLGDPVIGVDVTEDDKWVLSTTSHYLLLIPTAFGNKTGFTHPMGNNQRPKPFKLQLRPFDRSKYNIKKVSFSPVHFDVGDNIREKWIVTFTGPYILTQKIMGIIITRSILALVYQ